MEKFNIAPVSDGITEKLQEKIDSKTKPVGALGFLEDIALKIGCIQQSLVPKLNNPVIAVFAGDHGIAEECKVNAYPQEVTWQMVQNFLEGGAAINVFCKQHGIRSKIVDAGVNHEFNDHLKLINLKIARGTRNYRFEPAMDKTQCQDAIKKGAKLVEKAYQNETNIIGFGEMGIGNTSSASILTSLLTGFSVETCTGKGTGLDKDGVERKVAILKEAIDKHSVESDPINALTAFGGFEIAMIVGAILQAAENKMIIIIDGFIVTAALLVAEKLHPAVKDYCLFAHTSEERGHQKQLEYLDARPILNLGMRLGEGTGAAVAFPIIETAVGFLNEMASFEQAEVSKGLKT